MDPIPQTIDAFGAAVFAKDAFGGSLIIQVLIFGIAIVEIEICIGVVSELRSSKLRFVGGKHVLDGWHTWMANMDGI